MEETRLADTFAATVNSKKLENYGKKRVAIGIGNYQGQRLTIQIIVYASEIPNLFGIVSRPIIESHVSEIKEYILKRVNADKKWILGAITANVEPKLIECKFIGSNLYLVSIPNATPLKITDGQHRISAIALIMTTNHRELIANEQIPITLVLNGSERQADVDFQDMAKGTSIPDSLLVAFNFEGRDAIAKELVKRVDWFKNSTRWDSASAGSGSKYLYTLNFVAGLVGCAMQGEKNALLEEYDNADKIEQIGIELSETIDQFFLSCPATKALAQNYGELTSDEVKDFRASCILGLGIGLEILGCLIYQLRQGNLSITQIATDIDWSRENKLWNEIFPRKRVTTSSNTLGILPLNDAIERLIA